MIYVVRRYMLNLISSFNLDTVFWRGEPQGGSKARDIVHVSVGILIPNDTVG